MADKTTKNFTMSNKDKARAVFVNAAPNQVGAGQSLPLNTPLGKSPFGHIDPFRNNGSYSAIDQSLANINKFKSALSKNEANVFVKVFDFETIGPLPDFNTMTKDEIIASGFSPIEIGITKASRVKNANGVFEWTYEASSQKIKPTKQAITLYENTLEKFKKGLPLDKSETYMLHSFTKYADTPTTYQMSQLTLGTTEVKKELLANIEQGWKNSQKGAIEIKDITNVLGEGQWISAHNSRFDTPVGETFGVNFKGKKMIDTRDLDQYLNPLAALRREALTKVHGVEAITGEITTHRAKDDTRNQAKVLTGMIDSADTVDKRINTFGYTSTKTIFSEATNGKENKIKVGDHITSLSTNKVKDGYQLVIHTGDNAAHTMQFKTESDLRRFTISNFVSKQSENEALMGVKFNFNSGGSVVIPKSYNAALDIVEGMSNREKMDVFTQLKQNIQTTFNQKLDDIENAKWISRKAQKNAIQLERNKYKTLMAPLISAIDDFSTSKKDMYLKNGMLASLISSNGIQGQEYAKLIGAQDNAIPVKNTFENRAIQRITSQIKDSNLNYAVIDGDKPQIAIFHKNKYDSVIQKLQSGRALSEKEALMIYVPTIDEKSGQVFYKNSAKANNVILKSKGDATTVHGEMLNAIYKHIGSKQLAQDLANGNIYRSQQVLNRDVNNIFALKASTSRYHHSEINKPVANNTIRSKIASKVVDISDLVVEAHKGLTRTNVSSFTDIYDSEWTNILRDVVSGTKTYGNVYGQQDGQQWKPWSNLGNRNWNLIEQIRGGITGKGYNLENLDVSSLKPSTLIGRGVITFTDNDPRQFTALEFLTPTKKDSAVRSQYGFRPLDADSTRTKLSGTSSYLDRHLYSEAESLTDYYLGKSSGNTQARGMIVPTLIADDSLIAKLSGGLSADKRLTLSNYDGQLLMDDSLKEAFTTTQEKIYHIDENLGLKMNLAKDQFIDAGGVLAKAQDGASVGDVLLKGKYGGTVKNVSFNQETGFYDVIMTEIQGAANGGRVVGDHKGSIHYTNFKNLGLDSSIGAIQSIDKVDENEAAKLVRGTVELMASKVKNREEKERLVTLINEQIFKINDPTKALARLNDDNLIIINNTITKDQYHNAFQKGNRGFFGALHDFKNAVGRDTDAVKATIKNINGVDYDVFGALLSVGDVDQSWRVSGNRGALGRGIKIGPRELQALQESSFFYKYAMGDAAGDEGNIIYNSFRKSISQEGVQKKSQEFWYGYKALTEENLISVKDGNAQLGKTFGDFFKLTDKAQASADNFDARKDANVYSFIDSSRTSAEVKDLTHTMKAAQIIDEYKYGYSAEGAMNTVIDPKIAKKGLYTELPQIVDEGNYQIRGLYLPSSETQRLNGGLIANELQNKYDYALKASTDYAKAAENGNIPKDIQERYFGAVRGYQKTFLSEMSRKDGTLIKQTMSGEMFNTSYLTAQSMNIELYSEKLEQALKAGPEAVAALENTVHINPKTMQEMLDGHVDTSDYLTGKKQLNGHLHRFPTLGGNSLQASNIVASSEVAEGTMMPSLGMFLRQAGDYDTDKAFLMLNQKNADGTIDEATMIANKKMQYLQAQRSATFGKYAVKKFKETSAGISNVTMEELWSFSQAIGGQTTTESESLIKRFGKDAASMQVDFENYLQEIVQKGGPYADAAKALSFESRAQMQIGSVSNLSMKLRTLAGEASEKIGKEGVSGILEATQILEQVTAISSKHLSSANISTEAIKANTGLVKALRELDSKSLIDFMDKTGLFTEEGQLIKTFGLDLDHMNEVMDQSGKKMSHKQQIAEAFDTLQAIGLNKQDMSRASGKYGYSGIENIGDMAEAINDLRTPREAMKPIMNSLSNAGIDISDRREFSHLFSNMQEAVDISSRSWGGIDDAAIPSMQDLFARGKGASKTAAAEAFNFAKLKEAAPFVAAGLGLAALAGIATAPNVKRRTQESIATDGAQYDPAMAQILSESAPIGSGPTARVNPQQYKKTTVKIKANASGGLTNDELSGIIEKEIYRQTSIPVSINYTNKDDRQTIDKNWVEDQFIKAINAGKTT